VDGVDGARASPENIIGCCSAFAAIYGNAGKNCGETDFINAKGACWLTRSSGWTCYFTGASNTPRLDVPPPK